MFTHSLQVNTTKLVHVSYNAGRGGGGGGGEGSVKCDIISYRGGMKSDGEGGGGRGVKFIFALSHLWTAP